jgi:hypothetical protein
VRERTLHEYRSIVRRYLAPPASKPCPVLGTGLGRIQPAGLSAVHIQELYNAMRARKNAAEPGLGLAPGAVRYTHAIIWDGDLKGFGVRAFDSSSSTRSRKKRRRTRTSSLRRARIRSTRSRWR